MVYTTLCCFVCSEFTCKQESRFLDHLTDVHGLIDYETAYVENVLSGVKPRCACNSTCDVPLTWSGWKKGYTSKYVLGHNARVDSVYFDKSKQDTFVQKRLEGYRTGRIVNPMKGKTKANNPIVAAAAIKKSDTLRQKYASGELVPWQTNLTKESSASILKASQTHKKGFQDGKYKIWSQGHTKETDKRLANIAILNAKTMSETFKLSADEVKERIEKTGKFILISPTEDYKHRRVDRLLVRCLICQTDQLKSLGMIEDTPVCFTCHPHESYGELELRDFVSGLGVNVVCNDRTLIAPQEIDVLIHSHKLGIEYNGLYHHSDHYKGAKAKNYHSNKSRSMNDKGYELLHIFEDDWKNKRAICESVIRTRLGFVQNRIFARNCYVKEITPRYRKEFLDTTHIDGDVRALNAWGLYTKLSDKLVAVLSIRCPQQKKKYGNSFEIARFASALNTVVVGGLSKVIKHVIEFAKQNSVTRLISYVNTAFGAGKSYTKAGFVLKGETVNQFWWTDGTRRINRFKIRADKKNGITQVMACETAKVYAIYGCPNNLFELLV